MVIDEQEYDGILDEFDDNAKEVNIPIQFDQANQRNFKRMQDKERLDEPVIIDRVIFKERPHINQIDRSVQAMTKTADASTQTNLKMKYLDKIVQK